jgi:hypothetical protein
VAVVIGEIVSEVVLADGSGAARAPDGATVVPEDEVERIVRRATERVLEHLRREWAR